MAALISSRGGQAREHRRKLGGRDGSDVAASWEWDGGCFWAGAGRAGGRVFWVGAGREEGGGVEVR